MAVGEILPSYFLGRWQEMKNISIDIETYSDVDLQKCGVYKYVESDNFEILLFAYSVDGSEVTVVDLAKEKKSL